MIIFYGFNNFFKKQGYHLMSSNYSIVLPI